MKIYLPISKMDPHEMANPFVYTIIDCMQATCPDIKFQYSIDFFWSDDCESMDIIHFMWPNDFEFSLENGNDFKGRLVYLKTKGIKVISTCHNFYAHVQYTSYSNLLYDWVFEASDCIVHLGNYSLSLFQHKYPNTHQIVIPHHVYDTVFSGSSSKSEGLEHLGLSSKYRYILCLGAFRNDDERHLVEQVSLAFADKKVKLIAPNIMEFPIGRKNPKLWFDAIKKWIKYRFKYGMVVAGKYVSNEDIRYYYGASEISFIQRVNILNSGNVSLGFFMGNVVVGPDSGNVGASLKETNNPVFDPNNIDSVIKSVNEALDLAVSGLGMKNRNYSMANFLTAKISKQYLAAYSDLLSKCEIADLN